MTVGTMIRMKKAAQRKIVRRKKMERDKSQGSSNRKAVVPGPAEHPLQYNYTFWYSRRTPGRPTSSQSYEQNIKQIGTFASVSTYWFNVVSLGSSIHAYTYTTVFIYLPGNLLSILVSLFD